jgi:hypothetical protein
MTAGPGVRTGLLPSNFPTQPETRSGAKRSLLGTRAAQRKVSHEHRTAAGIIGKEAAHLPGERSAMEPFSCEPRKPRCHL